MGAGVLMTKRMFERFKSFRKNKETAFSMLEVLMVIVILAILFAIATPIYINQQKAGLRNSLQSDITNTFSNLKNWQRDQSITTYNANPSSKFNDLTVVSQDTATITLKVYNASDPETMQYCVQGTDSALGETWSVNTRDTSIVEGTCPTSLNVSTETPN